MRRGPAFVLALLLGGGCCLAAFSACSGKGDTAAKEDAGQRKWESLTPEASKKVLARVGDKTITLGDFAAALENMDTFERLRYQSKERRKELLDELITVQLLADEAVAKGYDKDPTTQEELRGVLRDALLRESRKDMPDPVAIPESEARAYFDAHRAEYKDPERRRVSAIVTKDEPSANAALVLAQKADTPAAFGELVRAKSIDSQARANLPTDLAGDLGIVSPPGDRRGDNPRVPEEVRVAVFSIAEVGKVADRVVAAAGKFYVVRLAQKLEPRERTFQEAERTIRIKLAQDRGIAKEEELLVALKKKYAVKIDEAALSTVRVDFPDAGAR